MSLDIAGFFTSIDFLRQIAIALTGLFTALISGLLFGNGSSV